MDFHGLYFAISPKENAILLDHPPPPPLSLSLSLSPLIHQSNDSTGDSAGAHFATTVALTLSTEDNSDLPSLKFQVLQVPTVQFLDLRLPSYQDYHKFYSFIEAPSMAVNIAIYLGYGKLIHHVMMKGGNIVHCSWFLSQS